MAGMTEHTKESEMLYALVCSGGRTPQKALTLLGARPQGILAAIVGNIASVHDDQVMSFWNKVAPAVRRRLQKQIQESND